jgi:4-hydroxybenzoate polyprenyltransferase
MKRITWWPQAWLGLVFSWGALVGWPAVTGSLATPALWLYAGSVAWVIGYDTLYAIQDVEDDALVGVRSSARRLGDQAPLGVAVFYALAVLLWGAALWAVRPDWVALLALGPAAVHLGNQAMRADPKDGAGALRLFRSNRTAGLLVFLAMLVVGLSSR